MDTFKWDSSFDTGLSEVDAHHHHLISLVNALSSELVNPKGVDLSLVERIYGELASYADYHFSEEQRLMTDANVDPRHTTGHFNDHSQFLQDVTGIRSAYAHEDPRAAEILLAFLTTWLTYHILGTDKAMARQINAIRGGLTPAAAFAADEQGPVDGSTNHLLQALKRLYEVVSAQNRRLVEGNQSLEVKVAERTHSLATAVNALSRATEDLRISEERMNRAINIMQAGICEVDLTTGAMYRSPRHDQIFGYETLLPEWNYNIFLSHVIPEDHELVKSRLLSALKASQDWDFECHIVRSDRDVRWVRAFGHHYFDAKGDTVRRVGLFIDITESRLLSDTLNESRERLSLATKVNRIGMWDWNLVTQTLEWDDTLFELYGRRREEFSGIYEAWTQCVHPDDLMHSQTQLQQSIQENLPFDCDFRVVLPDGGIRFINAKAKVFHDNAGKPLRMLGTNMDITAREAVERRLSSALNLSEKVISSAPIGINVYQGDSGQCLSVNDAMSQIVGATQAQLLAQNFRNIQSWKATELLSAAELALATGENQQVSTKVKTSSGKNIWILAVFASFNHEGKRRLILLLEDITERKEAEMAQEVVVQELQAALTDIRALSGLLPICSTCKKIRDDQGYWNQIESYISTHSEATFTHGVCPDCAIILFPGFKGLIKNE